MSSDSQILRLKVIYNPWSGRGLGPRLARALSEAAASHNCHCELSESQAAYESESLAREMQNFDGIVVVGGDGTLMSILPAAAASGVPVYMVPAGNESLFARRFGMGSEPQQILQAFRTNNRSSHFYGLINERPFFFMASIGLDADVVHRLAMRRRGPVTHFSYVLPTVAAFIEFRSPNVTLTIDGRTVLRDESGYLVIANAREYAGGLELVTEAHSEKNELCARFFRGMTRRAYSRLLFSLLTKRPGSVTSEMYSGSIMRVETQPGSPSPVQADGDFVGQTPAELRIAPQPIIVPVASTLNC